MDAEKVEEAQFISLTEKLGAQLEGRLAPDQRPFTASDYLALEIKSTNNSLRLYSDPSLNRILPFKDDEGNRIKIGEEEDYLQQKIQRLLDLQEGIEKHDPASSQYVLEMLERDKRKAQTELDKKRLKLKGLPEDEEYNQIREKLEVSLEDLIASESAHIQTGGNLNNHPALIELISLGFNSKLKDLKTTKRGSLESDLNNVSKRVQEYDQAIATLGI